MAANTEVYYDVKQMVRNLAKGPAGPDSKNVQEVDAELDFWYKQGYKLVNAFYLMQTEAYYSLLYILAKR